MSHIQWYYGDNKKGGMWSQDYTTTDKYSTCKEDEVSYDEHIRIATKLISKQKDQIFENAYNIERYFEIRLIESEIDSINDEILSNSVKKKCNHMNYIADVNAQLAMSKKITGFLLT